MKDEQNPYFLFQQTDKNLLIKIANGELDAIQHAKRELAFRGLDQNGNQTTFKKSNEIWNPK